MGTLDRDFIERQPKFKIDPDAQYTCTICRHHATVASAQVAAYQEFSDRLTIHCGRCNRSITLIEQRPALKK